MRSLRSCLRTATIAALSTLSLAAASLGSIAVPPANATLTALNPAATSEESVQDVLNDDTDEDEDPQSNASQSGDQDEGDDEALLDEWDEELEETVPSKSLLSSPSLWLLGVRVLRYLPPMTRAMPPPLTLTSCQ